VLEILSPARNLHQSSMPSNATTAHIASIVSRRNTSGNNKWNYWLEQQTQLTIDARRRYWLR
jgi:hypothetical protein